MSSIYIIISFNPVKKIVYSKSVAQGPQGGGTDDRLHSQYLELLTQQFYNHLWSKINREQDKKTLSELCSLFTMYVTQDEQHNHCKSLCFPFSKANVS